MLPNPVLNENNEKIYTPGIPGIRYFKTENTFMTLLEENHFFKSVVCKAEAALDTHC